jgi:6-phosphogluconolactonase
MSHTQRTLAYIGCYADADKPGIIACEYDAAAGRFRKVQEVSGLKNPTFLAVDRRRLMLYAIAERTDASGQKRGAACAFKINETDGTLTAVNEEETVRASTCHITLDATGRCLITASYHGGLVGLNPVLEDGRVGPVADVRQHEGSSVHPVQTQARAHSVFVDRANRYAVACDLGLDKLIVYRLDLENMKLVPHSEATVAPGSGPRHIAFHPTQARGYVINELSSTVTAFDYDAELGVLREIQTIATLPESFQGENACADIHISADGRFLYGSNRGHDSIVVYAVDPQDGRLRLVEHVSTRGGHPRNFALSPDDRFVLVANRDGDNVVTFARDADTGRLTATGDELHVSKPVCVKFLPLA